MPLWLSTFEEEVDSYIFISSRDSKLYLGILRSYDQHGNLFLTHCVEKIIVTEKSMFSDVYVGNIILRGDNIAYFGSVDEEKYSKIFDYTESKHKEQSSFLAGENEEKHKTEKKLVEAKEKIESNENSSVENIILQYVPVSHILKYTNSVNDSASFEN